MTKRTFSSYDCGLARRRDRPLLGSDADFSPGDISCHGSSASMLPKWWCRKTCRPLMIAIRGTPGYSIL